MFTDREYSETLQLAERVIKDAAEHCVFNTSTSLKRLEDSIRSWELYKERVALAKITRNVSDHPPRRARTPLQGPTSMHTTETPERPQKQDREAVSKAVETWIVTYWCRCNKPLKLPSAKPGDMLLTGRAWCYRCGYVNQSEARATSRLVVTT